MQSYHKCYTALAQFAHSAHIAFSKVTNKVIEHLSLFSSLSLFTLSAITLGQSAYAQVSTAGGGSVSSNGAYTYSIPIRMPPGTTAVQPALSLNYSSQGGNGIAGVGWNIAGLSVITRCPATKAIDGYRGGVNLDANDKLCLDGQRLILQAGTYGQGGSTYVTEIFNGSIVTQVTAPTVNPLIMHVVNPTPIISYVPNTGLKIATQPKISAEPATNAANAAAVGYPPNVEFIAKTKAGEVMEYSRAEVWGATSGTQGNTRMWLLTRVVDTHGNYWSVDYTLDTAIGEFTVKAINYTGNSKLGTLPYNKIEFEYEPRQDVSMAYIGGLKLSNTKRIKVVRTWATATGGTSQQPVTEYRFNYSRSASSKRSILDSVQEFANQSFTTGAAPVWSGLNPITFTYNTPAPNLGLAGGSALGLTDQGWSKANFWSGDFDGDGKTDLLTRTEWGDLNIWRSTGNGIAAGGGLNTCFTNVNDFDKGQHFFIGDMNGDGKSDLIAKDYLGYFYTLISTGSGFTWGASDLHPT